MATFLISQYGDMKIQKKNKKKRVPMEFDNMFTQYKKLNLFFKVGFRYQNEQFCCFIDLYIYFIGFLIFVFDTYFCMCCCWYCF